MAEIFLFATDTYSLKFDSSSTLKFSGTGTSFFSVSSDVTGINTPIQIPITDQSNIPASTAGKIHLYADTNGKLCTKKSNVNSLISPINTQIVSIHNNTTLTTYTTIGSFAYRGSDTVGVPSAINVYAVNGATTYSVRIFDVTNISVICELTGQTNKNKSIISMGAISNIPTTPAIFEIQALATAGAGKNAIINTIEIVY